MTAATVLGLQVGSTAPAFLAVLAVHVPAGLAAVVTGAAAVLTRKGSPRHVAAGRAYVWAVRVMAITALTLALMRWPADAYLAVLAVACTVAAITGPLTRRPQAPQRLAGDRPHVLGMGISYVVLLTAFYVDNGPHLPVWDLLPVPILWTTPTLLGGAVIGRALHRGRSVDRDPQAAGPGRGSG